MEGTISEVDQLLRVPDSPARGTVGAGGVVPSIRPGGGISSRHGVRQ